MYRGPFLDFRREAVYPGESLPSRQSLHLASEIHTDDQLSSAMSLKDRRGGSAGMPFDTTKQLSGSSVQTYYTSQVPALRRD